MHVPPLVHRLKLAVATHGPVIAAVLVLVGLVSFAGAAWAVTHPPTVEVTEQVATHTVGTGVETSTVVTGNTSLWERGTTLEDKPLYPISSAPLLTVSIQTSVPTGQEVQVSQELSLVYQASRDGSVFWNTERLLVAEERTVTDGVVSASSTFDVREVQAQLEEINGEITGIAQAEAYLRLNVSYTTGTYSGTLSKTAPLVVTSSGYWIGGSLDAENTHQTPVTREVSQSPVTATVIGFGLLGLVSLGGAGGVVYLSSRRLDPDAIVDVLDRQRYREWVSTGQIGHVVASQNVLMDTLKDLVDVAIDSNHRVVHDQERNLYAVVDDNVVYYFDPYHSDPEPEIEFEPEVGATIRHDGGFTSPFSGGLSSGDRSKDQPESGGRSATGQGPRGAEGGRLPRDAVSETRAVEPEGDRLVFTYRLSSDESGPVSVDVIDREAHEDANVESVNPQPEFEPAQTVELAERIEFRATVPAEGTSVVKFVLRPAESAWWSTLETIRSAPAPRVSRVVSQGDSEGR